MRRNHEERLRIWLLGGFRVPVGSQTICHDEWRLRKAPSNMASMPNTTVLSSLCSVGGLV
jgi:hypothetical protein